MTERSLICDKILKENIIFWIFFFEFPWQLIWCNNQTCWSQEWKSYNYHQELNVLKSTHLNSMHHSKIFSSGMANQQMYMYMFTSETVEYSSCQASCQVDFYYRYEGVGIIKGAGHWFLSTRILFHLMWVFVPWNLNKHFDLYSWLMQDFVHRSWTNI